MRCNLVMAWRNCNIKMSFVLPIWLITAQCYSQDLSIPAVCSAKMAEVVQISSIDGDGDLRLVDGRVLRLAGIDWPAADQADQRAALRQGLAHLVAAGDVMAETSGPPDRWGRLAAQVFVRQPQADVPDWVQGAVLGAGLVAAWPESAAVSCWPAALSAEAAGRESRAGIWATYGATGGRSALLRPRGDSPMSRRVVFESVVSSVRPGRRVTFVNFSGPREGAPSLMLSVRQVRELLQAGRDPATFMGKRLRIRAEMDNSARPRLSIVGPQAIDVLE